MLNRSGKDIESSRITLGILRAIERQQEVTQRAVAVELGIALGLVNAYLKRCMKKGLVKVANLPARRYAYFLTPKGFAEKSRLTASFLSHSFAFFREARRDCDRLLGEIAARRMRRVALLGASELAEIMILCAMERPISIVAIVDNARSGRYAGVPIVRDIDALPDFDALIITELSGTSLRFHAAVNALGADRVFVPLLLRNQRLSEEPSSWAWR